MKKHFNNLLCAIFCFFTLGVSLITSPATFAAGNACDSNVPASVQEAAGCNNNTNKDSLKNTIIKVIDGFLAIIGLVALVFIISGGIQYITSMGNPQKAEKARHTILYAVIGLIICALSYAIVNFVIGIL